MVDNVKFWWYPIIIYNLTGGCIKIKRLKYYAVFFFVFCFISLALNSDGFAKEKDIVSPNDETEYISNNEYYVFSEYARKFLSEMGRPSELSRPIPLYNPAEELVAVNFSLDNGGYIIVNTNDFSIPEFSFENESPFNSFESCYIYNGPLAYYKKEGNNYIDLLSGKVISGALINNAANLYSGKVKSEQKFRNGGKINNKLEYKSQADASEKKFILSPPLKTWYKPGGYCGPIAASYVFMFYDEVKNDNFVSSEYENESLIDLLIPYIDPESDGSSTEELRNGMLQYIWDRGLRGKYTVAMGGRYTYNSIKERIRDFKSPVIIDTDNHAVYKEHWITSYGYYDNGKYHFLIVNDGWGHNGVFIDWDSGYYDEVVFITP